jgi:hypothetical protein
MRRWVVLALAVGTAVAACSKSNGGGATGSGDDAGDGGHCPCMVPADDAGIAMAAVPCGEQQCVGGAVEWYCSNEGSPTPMGACPPVENDGGGVDAACTPTCPMNACNIDDGCGHLCQCTVPGDVCQNSVCGNGCGQTLGGYCGIGGDASTSCCQSGLQCQPRGEAGAPTCCAITGLGTCTADTDCCDYPSVHCDLGDGGPSAPDAAKPSQKCM